MKAIMIWFSLVLVLFHPTRSNALEHAPAYHPEFIQQNALHFSYNSQNKDIYGDYQIIEEDEEDLSISSKKKVLAKKIISTNASFITSIFFDDFFKKIRSSKHLFYTRPPTFISLRVLRL